MSRSRKWLAAVCAGAVAAPAGMALAAGPPAPPTRPNVLGAPLVGYATVAGQMRVATRDGLIEQHLVLHRRLARLTGARTRAGHAVVASRYSAARLRRENARLRARVQKLDTPVPSILMRIAQCESHGDPRAIGGGGLYRGRYQMTIFTWQAAGGSGDPIAASAAEQDRRAAVLLARSGPGQWPTCAA